MTHTKYLSALVAALILTGATGVRAAGEATGTTPGQSGTAGETRGGAVGEAANDTWLTTKVKSALLADPATSGLDVQVQTQNGVVQLSGFVGSEAEQRRAEDIAQRIDGVKKVKNDLRLKAEQR